MFPEEKQIYLILSLYITLFLLPASTFHIQLQHFPSPICPPLCRTVDYNKWMLQVYLYMRSHVTWLWHNGECLVAVWRHPNLCGYCWKRSWGLRPFNVWVTPHSLEGWGHLCVINGPLLLRCLFVSSMSYICLYVFLKFTANFIVSAKLVRVLLKKKLQYNDPFIDLIYWR